MSMRMNLDFVKIYMAYGNKKQVGPLKNIFGMYLTYCVQGIFWIVVENWVLPGNHNIYLSKRLQKS